MRLFDKIELVKLLELAALFILCFILFFLVLRGHEKRDNGPRREAGLFYRLAPGAIILAQFLLIGAKMQMQNVPMETLWVEGFSSGAPSLCYGDSVWRGSVFKSGPVFPIALGMADLIFGFGIRSISLFQAIMSAVTLFLLYLLCTKLSNRKAAIAMIAIYFLVDICFSPGWELSVEDFSFQNTIFLGFLIVLVSSFDNPSGFNLLSLGALAGLGISNKASFVLLLIPAAFLVILSKASYARKAARKTHFFLFGFALGALPFLIYNINFGFPLVRGAVGMLAGGEGGRVIYSGTYGELVFNSGEASGYSPLEIGKNLLVRAQHFLTLSESIGWLKWFAAACVALCFAYGLLPAREDKPPIYLPFLFLLILFSSSFSYHQLQNNELRGFYPLVFLTLFYPVLLLKDRPIILAAIVLLFLLAFPASPRRISEEFAAGKLREGGNASFRDLVKERNIGLIVSQSCPSARIAYFLAAESSRAEVARSLRDYSDLIGGADAGKGVILVFEKPESIEEDSWQSSGNFASPEEVIGYLNGSLGASAAEISGYDEARYFKAYLVCRESADCPS
ncbi:MAG: glycosyltransferase family 39 protein [archaeon]